MGLSYGKQRPSQWPDLPPELAGLILCRLLSHTDRLSFTAVCRPWRLAGQQHRPVPPPLPWLRLHDRLFQGLPGGELRRFKAADDAPRYYLDCFDGWLFFARLGDGGGTRFLLNPSTGRTLVVPEFRFRSGCTFPRKMIVRSSPDDDDLVAASSYDSSEVAFYKPGAVSWSIHPSTSSSRLGRYADMAFHRGKLYVLTTKEDLLVHGVGDAAAAAATACHVERVIKGRQDQVATRLYLVASCGKLLMVKVICSIGCSGWDQLARDNKSVEKVVLKVFQADLGMGRWLEVKALDCGQALFVGRGGSKAVPLIGHDEIFPGNRVYFTGDDLALCLPLGKDVPSYGFYDLSSGTFGQVFLKTRGYSGTLYRSQGFFHCT